MYKLIIIFTTLFFASKVAMAQDELLERLTGERVTNEIYLQITGDEIKYKLDPVEGLRDNTGFTLPGQENVLWNSYSPKIKLRFGFYNPYKYAVTVKQDIQEDPVNKSAEEFINLFFNSYLGSITVGTPQAFDNIAPSSGFLARRLTRGTAPAIIFEPKFFTTPSIVQWYLWTEQSETAVCSISSRDNKNTVLKKIENIERILYHNIRLNLNGTNSDSISITNHLNKIVTIVYSPENLSDFRKEYAQAVLYKEALKKEILIIKTSLDEIENIQKTLTYSGGSNVEERNYCKVFNIYNQQTFIQYIGEIKEKHKKLVALTENLDLFLQIGKDYIENNEIKDANGGLTGLAYREELNADYKNLRTITINVKKIELNPHFNTEDPSNGKNIFIKEKKEISRGFRLVRHRRSWAEATGGLSYSNIEYVTYSTKQDGTNLVVAEPTILKPRAIAALFYNQVFNINTYPIFPIFQMGLATGKEYPTLLLGSGFRFISNDSKRLSLTVGLALPFTRELETLEPGSPVTSQDDIDKDLRFRLGARKGFYLGVAWKI